MIASLIWLMIIIFIITLVITIAKVLICAFIDDVIAPIEIWWIKRQYAKKHK